MLMWRPAGPETPSRAPLQVSLPPRSSRRNRLANRRASRYAREHQGRRAREPLPGFEKVRAEWAIVCTVHNLLKLAQRRSLSETFPMAA
jgi:hypothetical protein